MLDLPNTQCTGVEREKGEGDSLSTGMHGRSETRDTCDERARQRTTRARRSGGGRGKKATESDRVKMEVGEREVECP